ncbi:hypothetical protein FOA43_003655 [Brettanomyces nanus]|uniref:Na+/H+ antiporter n=1 Tax=Eeniella nana TaxID=13502 RepID=A0A875S9F1_EENNA|nr:uncharacterized protein FOA43_003655 [Brettanomyces nanus]QPG76269.1 hypothetical protein FOA43_003655 [Brettanomyces nanus]
MLPGFLIIGLFTWLLIPDFSYSESLLIAACVTATDPVLAQAVVGKGKFAQRVPAHLRNLLNAESACNDGISVPFTYLALNLIVHAGQPGRIAKDFLVNTVLYECVFGSLLGVIIGYVGRKLLRFAERRHLIDAESFLAFYILLAVLCAGFGSILGCDDLLASFCAGTAFAWDSWFTKKTMESHVSTVIDLLLNLSYFVYLGSIIPWQEFNDHKLGLDCWRLICLALCVIAFRRIPAIFAIKRICPDINNWKEALFVGHFGPIGVGAVYTSIIAIGDLEAEVLHLDDGPTSNYPTSLTYYTLIRVIWPCVTFLIVTSIVVHGSSVAVMALGRHLQSMSFTLTFTRTETMGGGWTTRLPKRDKNGNYFVRHTDRDSADAAQDEPAELTDSSAEDVVAIPAGLHPRKKRRRRKKRKGLARFTRARGEFIEEENPKPVELDLRKGRHNSNDESVSSYSRSTSSTGSLSSLSVIGSVAGSLLLNSPTQSEKQAFEDEFTNPISSSGEPSPENSRETGNGTSIGTKGAANDGGGGNINHVPTTSTASGSNDVAVAVAVPSVHISDTSSESFSNSNSASESGPELNKEESKEQALTRMVTYIRGNPELLEKLQREYQLTEADLEPVYRDGEFRVPTRGYKDGGTLVIEDQHGEVLRSLKSVNPDSDQESVRSLRSISSLHSLKRTLSKLASKVGVPMPKEDSQKNDKTIHEILSEAPTKGGASDQNNKFENALSPGTPSTMHRINSTHSIRYVSNDDHDLQGGPSYRKTTEESSLSPPSNRVVKTVTPGTSAKSDVALGPKERLRKKIKYLGYNKPRRLHISEKLHGFRVGDTIIIEDREGNVVGTYKINPEREEIYNTKPDDLVSKALQAVGLARQSEPNVNDREKNLEGSSTLYPAEDTIDDKRIESKLRAFIKNPGKFRMDKKDARRAARNYKKEHREDEDSEEDDESHSSDSDSSGDQSYSSGQSESSSESGRSMKHDVLRDSGSESEDKIIEGKGSSGIEKDLNQGNQESEDSQEDQDEIEEKLAQEVIDKQKVEDKKRRREGSSARRLKRGIRHRHSTLSKPN